MSASGPTFSIRPARSEDLVELVAFQLQMAQETEELQLDAATVTKGVQALFQNPALGVYYIVENSDGTCAGCFLTIGEWSDWRNGMVLWIHSVYLLPQVRGQGLFRQCYEYLQDKVRGDAFYRGLRLYVDKRNLHAQKVYQSLGMSKEHYELYEWMN